MHRARFQNQDDWQQPRPPNWQRCLSFIFCRAAVLVIAGFLTLLALNSPISTSALEQNPSSLSQV